MGLTNFSIFTRFKAKDNVSPVLSAITRKTGALDRVMNRFNLTQKGLGSCIATTTKKMNLLMNTFVGFFAVGQIKNFISNTVRLGEVQLAAETKLTQALKNNAVIRARGQEEYLKTSKELFAFASRLQTKGVLGDETVLGGMQTLAGMGFDDSVIKTIIPALGDLVVQQKGYNASVSDMENAAKGIGRALSGNFGALSRMGVVLDANKKKQLASMNTMQRSAYIAEILTERVGGMNEALAKTDRGAKIQFLNRWGDMLENIGLKIMPLEGTLFRNLNKHLPTIAQLSDKFFNALNWSLKALNPVFKQLNELFGYLAVHLIPELASKSPLIKSLFEDVFVPGVTLAIKAIEGLFKAIDGVYNFIKDHMILIIGIISGAGGMLAVKKAFDIASAAVTWFRTSMLVAGSQGLVAMSGFAKINFILGGFTKAVWGSVKAIYAQTTALLTNPWTWVAIGMGTVVGAAVLLWKNWDKITESFKNCMAYIKPLVANLFSVLTPIGHIIKALRYTSQLFKTIKGAWTGMRSVADTAGAAARLTPLPLRAGMRSKAAPAFQTPTPVNKRKENLTGNIGVDVTLSNKTDKNAYISTSLMGSNSLNLFNSGSYSGAY